MLDTPMGKNDGTVQNIQYFSCEPKHGIFVRGDKLIQDKRGKAMRAYKAEKLAKGMQMSLRHPILKTDSIHDINLLIIEFGYFTERESSMTRSKSRGDALNAVGTPRK